MDKLKDFWLQEENRGMMGWDFSSLDSRWEMDDLPWDYFDIVNKYNGKEYRLLDMGTGGGELLKKIGHPYNLTSITEGYKPNYELCKKELSPLGITVKYIEPDDIIPYEDETFDIVLNRHESYNPLEVKRVLKPKGIFITQQVGNDNNKEMSEYLLGKRNNNFPNCYLDIATKELLGFDVIESDEVYANINFFDIGALVYYAKIIEWEFEGFSVEKCYDKLLELQKQIDSNGFASSIEHRYYLVAQKK
jgi:Methylase involved in ubiquinone/menaquinone biosynthesis